MTVGGLTYQGTATTPLTLNSSYDSVQRPLTTSAVVNGATLMSQQRSYDNVGNVLTLNTSVTNTAGTSVVNNQSFCYDALSELVWVGNSGTPTGGDHYGTVPTGSTVTSSQQAFSYDALGRLTSGLSGNETYGDSNHTHATTALSTVPNQYASYDATGNMTCRNTDTTTSHTCAGSSPTGAQLSYDNEGHLVSWSSPLGGTTSSSDQFLYDAEGNRVLQHASSTTGGTTTVSDTITFDSYTETTITNSTTTTTKYYSAGGRTVAMAQGANWYGLVTDLLGNVTLAVNAQGQVVSAQLFTPYGSTSYSNGTMPTTYNYTGQRLDSVTGLLYYNARYYDPVSGRFTSADDIQSNNVGVDPYAYVNGNPETMTDPTGQCGFGSWGDFGDCFTQVAKKAEHIAQQVQQQAQDVIQQAVKKIPGWIIAVVVAVVVIVIAVVAFAAHIKTPDQTVANRLQKVALKQHQKLPPKQRNQDNYGGGNLQLTAPRQSASAPEPKKPFLDETVVVGSSIEEGGHSEEQVIDWALKLIAAQKQGSIGSIHLVLFTFKTPCDARCGPALKEGIWAQDLAAAAGINVSNVTISVWTQDGNPGSSVKPWGY